ncbi:MAG: exodeoxyribonuclease III [Elusimicrobia bacterium RIFCSPLOWO2_01_FULL_54_10]|nr:MAG: exodeoxyribonuclease III [Elusimicrobia bacterium RIFCSPLOWO2_01_FULL_54_10]
MKIATFNANSIRARLGIILNWLKSEKPDLLAIQETKVQDLEFPKDAIESLGWHVIFRGQKSYNGVAFVSKVPLKIVQNRIYPNDLEEDARFIETEINGVRIFNTYIPQGFEIDSPKYQKKLQFYKDLKAYFQKNMKPGEPALWMGDMNVAPTEIDLARPKENEDHVCFHIDARNALADIMKDTWVDLFREKEKGPGHYTYWDFRYPPAFSKNIGWRIDHILGTKPMVLRLKKIWIDKKPRALEKPSDHTFLVAEFS